MYACVRGALRLLLLCVACLLPLGAVVHAAEQQAAAIASAHPLATAAGHEILGRGGNAFDAAVAIAAVLAVVEPYSSGLGGGGFFLLHRARDGYQVMVDGRETAPGGVKREMYVGADGKPVPGATVRGGTAAAIPGAAAALVHVAGRYGALPLAEALAPAIRHARDGFAVDRRYARIAAVRERLLQDGAGTSGIFLDGKRAPRAGWLLRQPELAGTLERLASEGRSGFYAGPVARALVESVIRARGMWRLSDLEGYRVIERAPLRFRYRGAEITTAPLPSAGGIALAQCLNMLEHFSLADSRSPGGAHLVAETLRRAFHDRALYLGDGDFVAVPVERLASKAYAMRRAATINPVAATRSAAPEREPASGSGNTTHLSVVDADGNRVAATLTINLLFGAGIVADGTGVLLNNEMDDFTLRRDTPNAFRLRGGDANAIAPGKRPLSSMAPTFVEDGKGVLVVGAPGGSRIVSQVLLAVLDYVHARTVDLGAIVGRPRYHHQWWPDRVEIEPGGFPADWRAVIETKGHRIETGKRRWGNMQAVFRSKQTGAARAASDPRGLD
ncbi:MAG: gamma-glutamyltransferase [Betaproteobacteria bacterium]|nr:gamma-glutamyltransferase [Betaproteobacteria bacterium]